MNKLLRFFLTPSTLRNSLIILNVLLLNLNHQVLSMEDAPPSRFPRKQIREKEIKTPDNGWNASPLSSTIIENKKELKLFKIGLQGAEFIAQYPFRTLKKLDLFQALITNEGVTKLSGVKALSSLEELNLGFNHITEKGVKAFSTWDLPWLTILNLSHNEITDSEVRALVNENKFPKLQNLNLDVNKIGKDGAGYLMGSAINLNTVSVTLPVDTQNILDMAQYSSDLPTFTTSPPALQELSKLSLSGNYLQGFKEKITDLYKSHTIFNQRILPKIID